MKTQLNVKSFVLAMLVGLAIPMTSQALEDSKVRFTKDMHVSISTVTGNYFNAYDVLINRPLAQLVEVNSVTQNKFTPTKTANNVFAMAMQVQDKLQYFMAVVGDTFSDDDSLTTEQECRTTRLAKLFTF
ncbi:hypothetical protein [Thalassotalea sp. ND16A]|uniref:hypothetical protein n=1 Tax=Thalassotalea sp. ND16A TaxID=1535422 RepID=UPI00051A2EE2|nr:hypothetical protein [Thalassotalea sp. ND16A]KGJ90262.1 hypothetical protein ND16A_1992 [Thalassotalea sp. ND16A]